jgi:hypothetical protein
MSNYCYFLVNSKTYVIKKNWIANFCGIEKYKLKYYKFQTITIKINIKIKINLTICRPN